jgi:hypothetical protein
MAFALIRSHVAPGALVLRVSGWCVGYQGQVLDGSRADARRWCTSELDGGQQQLIGERRFAWALEFGVDALLDVPCSDTAATTRLIAA